MREAHLADVERAARAKHLRLADRPGGHMEAKRVLGAYEGGAILDAITLLKEDHKAVKRLFRQFEKTGDGATTKRRQLVDEIIEELSVHAAIEEQLFYPAARAAVPDALDHVLESLEEHHVVKWVLSELESVDPTAERFEAKVTVLIENVEHHAEEEEKDLFPKVRAALGRTALSELGDAMAKAKSSAPTRPHPRMPDTPPGNALAASVAAIVDAAKDAGKRTARSVNAAGRAMGRKGELRFRSPEGDVTERTRDEWQGGPEQFDVVRAEAELAMERYLLWGPADDDVDVLRAQGWDPTVARTVAERRAEEERAFGLALDGRPAFRQEQLRDLVAQHEVVVELFERHCCIA